MQHARLHRSTKAGNHAATSAGIIVALSAAAVAFSGRRKCCGSSERSVSL
jgi:hypothetical protein